MCQYKHLTLFEREKILFLRASGKSITAIATEIGRDKSTISRELRRNLTNDEYIPVNAEAQYKERREACRPKKKLSNDDLRSHVENRLLDCQWSPEQIDGRLRSEFGICVVSYATIYRAIYSGMLDAPGRTTAKVVKRLRHHGKRRRKRSGEERRGKITISYDISERPAEAENRSEIGHFEADTVVGKQGKACLVTLVDRKSRFLICGKAEGKNSTDVSNTMIEVLTGRNALSVTPDRGKEFAKHKEVTEALDGLPFYFPQPHQPWMRGTNENTNGLLREYFPKGKDISDMSREELVHVVSLLNLRPRKCLAYKTPYEVYYEKSLHLA